MRGTRSLEPCGSGFKTLNTILYLKEAAGFLRDSAAGGNVRAAKQYVQCMQYVGQIGFDAAEYLTTFVKENKSIDDVTRQNLYLDIATSHTMKNRKGEAFENYLKAIKINPDSKVLTVS